MKVTAHRPDPEDTTYDLEGLTHDEALFLRDLLGSFACNGNAWPHPHRELYAALERALGHYHDTGGKRYTVYGGSMGPGGGGSGSVTWAAGGGGGWTATAGGAGSVSWAGHLTCSRRNP